MIKKAAVVGALCVSALNSSAVLSAALEEVVVTAQLREQSLQDVPVSVSAISGEKMMEAGLSKIEDLQAYVPNFTMTESREVLNKWVMPQRSLWRALARRSAKVKGYSP